MAVTPQQQLDQWAKNFEHLMSMAVIAAWYAQKKVPGYKVLATNAGAEMQMWYKSYIKPYVKNLQSYKVTIPFNSKTYPADIQRLRAQAIQTATMLKVNPSSIAISMIVWDAWYKKYITKYNK